MANSHNGNRRITKRLVDSLAPGDLVWDSKTTGFGVRCQGRSKVFIVKGRLNRKPCWRTIGRYGTFTVKKAEDRAKVWLGLMADGMDPKNIADADLANMTVSELCDLYLVEGCATKKPSTLVTDKGRIERHIKPLVGKLRLQSITRADVERMMRDIAVGKTAGDQTTEKGRSIVRGGRGAASKSVTLLAVILEFARSRGVIAENPARGIKKFKDKTNERYLSSQELTRFGEALKIAETGQGQRRKEHPCSIAALRLLALTGCRKSEILELQWDHVDFERSCLRLPDSKTGSKVVLLGAAALEVLANLPRRAGSPYVLPGDKDGRPFVGLQKAWERIRKNADLEGVRVHDLRHSFASIGAGAGDSLVIIGSLLGHRDQSTTQRYAHLSNHPLKAAADRISGEISAAMRGDSKGNEVVSFLKRGA